MGKLRHGKVKCLDHTYTGRSRGLRFLHRSFLLLFSILVLRVADRKLVNAEQTNK